MCVQIHRVFHARYMPFSSHVILLEFGTLTTMHLVHRTSCVALAVQCCLPPTYVYSLWTKHSPQQCVLKYIQTDVNCAVYNSIPKSTCMTKHNKAFRILLHVAMQNIKVDKKNTGTLPIEMSVMGDRMMLLFHRVNVKVKSYDSYRQNRQQN